MADWAVILAGGEGVRLHSLTKDASGRATPKQYCSLLGGPTLMQDALRRAQNIVAADRLCAVVSDSHTPWWRSALQGLPAANIICQPSNRGTAIGVLLSVLWILQQDPWARLLFLPADHFVEDENTFCDAAQDALDELAGAPDDIVLLGIEPREPDSELGYILCGKRLGRSRQVVRFVEKPSIRRAERLVSRGALWNTFIFAVTASAILRRLRARMPLVVEEMQSTLARANAQLPDPIALRELYRSLPEVDFSREILAAAPTALRAVAAPDCGWSDLGTPQRVAEALRRPGTGTADPMLRPPTAEGSVCLAAMFRRLQAGN